MTMKRKGAHRRPSYTKAYTVSAIAVAALIVCLVTAPGAFHVDHLATGPARSALVAAPWTAPPNPEAFLVRPMPKHTVHPKAKTTPTPTPTHAYTPRHAKPTPTTPPPAPVEPLSGTLSCSGLEQLWDNAGGNPSYAFVAAEVARAESGGNEYARSVTDDVGYWQINVGAHPTLATYDPLGNARAAVLISSDGTNWWPWTTYQTGAYAGQC